jgi:hypothetical protein
MRAWQVSRGSLVLVTALAASLLLWLEGIPASGAQAVRTVGARCTRDFCIPASWDTERQSAPRYIPEIRPYVEPLNVIITARSDIRLGDVENALVDWSPVSSRIVDFRGFHLPCISPEKADVTGQGYVRETTAWRLKGCIEGNVLSLTGHENHIRIWNQPVSGGKAGAWFITASFETLCVSFRGKLKPLLGRDGHLRTGLPFHCVDGGPGSYGSDGYDRGAASLVADIRNAARYQHWKLAEKIVNRPVARRQNIGEDGVKFSGKVYVLTITGRPGVVTEIGADGFGYDYPSILDSSPLVTGPDGNPWMLAIARPGGPAVLQSVTASTGAVRSHPLPRSVIYLGMLAAGGRGNLWMSTTMGLVRYTVATGRSRMFPVSAACQGSFNTGGGQLSSASDGSVWVNCGRSFVRIAPGGSKTTVLIPSSWNIAAGIYGTLAAGGGGTMWAAVRITSLGGGVSTGIVKITPSGRKALFRDASGITSEAVVGNGTGKIVDISICTVGGTGKICYDDVAADGTRTRFATSTDFSVTAYYPPGMDREGNVWQLIDAGSGGPLDQNYLEITPGGSTEYFFQMPPPNGGNVLVPTGPPVITANGDVWAEQARPDQGYLLRWTPG